MSDVHKLVTEATEKLRYEADRLRTVIRERQEALDAELSDTREQLVQLEDAIARIDGTAAPTRSTPSGRAPRGQNRKLILEYLSGHSGATAREVSEATGITRATTVTTLAKLHSDNVIDKARSDRGVLHTLKDA